MRADRKKTDHGLEYMNACVYIYLYWRTHECMCIYLYWCTHECMCIYLYWHTHECMCIYLYWSTHECMCVYICTGTLMCAGAIMLFSDLDPGITDLYLVIAVIHFKHGHQIIRTLHRAVHIPLEPVSRGRGAGVGGSGRIAHASVHIRVGECVCEYYMFICRCVRV